jgi:hypothetical protein
MLKIFIFDPIKGKWIEESQILLFHDLAAVFDEDAKKIFIWKGNNIKQSKVQKGMESLEDLLSNFPNFKWKIITKEKEFPDKVHKRISSMLKATKERKQEEKLKYNHFLTIRLSFIVLIGILVFTILSFFNLIMPLFNPIINEAYQISASKYNLWLKIYQIFTILILVFLSCNFVISIYEQELEVFIISLIGIIISIGIILYLRQGIFLFIHQTGSTYFLYLISIKDLIIFILLNLLAILIVLCSTSYKLYKFARTYWKYIFISSKADINLGSS